MMQCSGSSTFPNNTLVICILDHPGLPAASKSRLYLHILIADELKKQPSICIASVQVYWWWIKHSLQNVLFWLSCGDQCSLVNNSCDESSSRITFNKNKKLFFLKIVLALCWFPWMHSPDLIHFSYFFLAITYGHPHFFVFFFFFYFINGNDSVASCLFEDPLAAVVGDYVRQWGHCTPGQKRLGQTIHQLGPLSIITQSLNDEAEMGIIGLETSGDQPQHVAQSDVKLSYNCAVWKHNYTLHLCWNTCRNWRSTFKWFTC